MHYMFSVVNGFAATFTYFLLDMRFTSENSMKMTTDFCGTGVDGCRRVLIIVIIWVAKMLSGPISVPMQASNPGFEQSQLCDL